MSQISADQILDFDITRDDINITHPTKSLITRVVAGANISLSSTGGMAGTGDVTINASVPVTSVAGRTGAITLSNADISGLGSAATQNTGTSAGNVPVLDNNGKLDTGILPALAVTDTFVVASQAAQTALTAEVGDVAVRTDLNKSFILKTSPPSTFSNWQELLTPTDAVQSVAGKTGVVTLDTADITSGTFGIARGGIGLSTIAANKLIYSSALDTFAPLTLGSALSITSGTLNVNAATQSLAGTLSAADKTKLDGIAAGATTNSTDAQLRDRSTHTGTQLANTISDFSEAVDDRVDALLITGAGLSKSYNDASNTLTISSTVTQYTDEMAQDAIAALLVAGSNISLTYNDSGNTLTIANTYSAPVTSVAGRTGEITLSNTDISGLGTAAIKNVPASGDAAATEVVLGNDSRLSQAAAFDFAVSFLFLGA